MAAELPAIPYPRFRRQILRLSPEPLRDRSLAALFAHYEELRRWARGQSLVGPAEGPEIVPRHYGDSLAALPLLGPEVRKLVDVGSGAGFPGLVLAAARPEVAVTLVEAKQRKWAFLMAASRRAGLSCACLNARVRSSLPAGIPADIDVVACRAVRVVPELIEAFLDRGRRLRFLLWQGRREASLPDRFTIAREVELPGERGRIVEIVPR